MSVIRIVCKIPCRSFGSLRSFNCNINIAIFFLDFTVELNVVTPLTTRTELTDGLDTVRLCFSAQLNRTLNRNATFNFLFSDLSTASLNTDFTFTSPSYLTFTAGSSGDVMSCIEIEIDGDFLVENDEYIIYDLVPVYELDRVLPSETSAFTINVVDDDGEEEFLFVCHFL